MMKKNKYHINDFLIVFAVMIATYLVAGKYDILEKLIVFMVKYEKYELDELITVALVLVLCLLVIVFRLFRDERKNNQTINNKNEQLKKAYEEIEVLKGIVPVCSYCKKIRDDNGVWNQMEVYIENKTQAKFSHSICDECMNKFYPPDEE